METGDEMIQKIQIKSSKQTEFINITNEINEIVRKSGVKSGICIVFIPHTTASVTINENADPNVIKDIVMELNKVIPFEDSYKHLEGNSPAHIKASLIGSSETILIESGRLMLGTWQGIFFCEFDGPRIRNIYVKIISDS